MYSVFIAQENKFLLDKILVLPVWAEQSAFYIADYTADGHTAMNLLVQNHYDLVIMDIHLPVTDGFTILKYFKECESTMLFVMTSGFSEHEFFRKILQLGAFDYLITPITNNDMEELLYRVEKTYHPAAEKDAINSKWAASLLQMPNVYTLIADHNPNFSTFFQNYINRFLSASLLEKEEADSMILTVFDSSVKWLYTKLPYLDNFLNIDHSITLNSIFDRYEVPSNVHYFTSKLNSILDFILILHPFTKDDTLSEIFDYILNNIDYDICQTQIAKQFFQTNTAFCKLFFQKTNLYFNDYIIEIKLLRAEYLLLNSNLLVYEVGNKIGYRDYNYFTKVFKNKYHLTPTSFRLSLHS